ncbi:MAG: acylphosphatase [Candidatus Micrarchaeota archaeon]|nr:acylphosphatase [Candidatus Micrarchaeota archaeon]
MEIIAIAKGRVQGVFFRSFVNQLAHSMKLKGYVKNLDDGDVEIVANGTDDMIAEFLEVIKAKKDPYGIYVESLSWEETKENEYSGFEKL